MRNRKFHKNKKKIKKKLKNTITDSFQAKIGWKMMRKGENKNYRSVPFLPDAQWKITKKQPKNSKNKKNTNMDALENSKKIVKQFKKFKNTIMDSFEAKIGWRTM